VGDVPWIDLRDRSGAKIAGESDKKQARAEKSGFLENSLAWVLPPARMNPVESINRFTCSPILFFEKFYCG
jgi:hypothetical protein